MSKKSKTLIQAVADASFAMGKVIEQQDNGEVINGSLAVYRETAAITELEDYIAALHDRIASLYKGPAVACTEGTVHRFSGGPSNTQNLPRAESDAYMGHAGTTGGLQQHSIGELYPCIIAKVGDVWQVDHSSLGFLASGFNTQAEAVAWAKNFKEQDR